jgi:hypothetical protein
MHTANIKLALKTQQRQMLYLIKYQTFYHIYTWLVHKSFIIVGDMKAASKLDKGKLGLRIKPQLQI